MGISVNLALTMKGTFFILAALIFVASSQTPPKRHPKHPMPRALQVLANLPKLLKKDLKNDPITDCTKCYNDVLAAIKDCTIDGQETHEILVCVETVLSTTADCITCVCDVLGILGGADSSACDPAKMLEDIRAKKSQLEFLKNH